MCLLTRHHVVYKHATQSDPELSVITVFSDYRMNAVVSIDGCHPMFFRLIVARFLSAASLQTFTSRFSASAPKAASCVFCVFLVESIYCILDFPLLYSLADLLFKIYLHFNFDFAGFLFIYFLSSLDCLDS